MDTTIYHTYNYTQLFASVFLKRQHALYLHPFLLVEHFPIFILINLKNDYQVRVFLPPLLFLYCCIQNVTRPQTKIRKRKKT